MLQDRSFFGGISIAVKDSLQGMSVVNSLDVKLTISAVGLSAFCTTRRMEVWSARFALIDDIRRGGPNGPAGAAVQQQGLSNFCSLVIDFKAQSHGNLYRHREEGDDDSEDLFLEDEDDYLPLGGSLNGSVSVYNNYRKMQCVIYHSSRDFVDEVFQTLLQRWSFRQVSATSLFSASSTHLPAHSTAAGFANRFQSKQIRSGVHPVDSSLLPQSLASTSAVTNPQFNPAAPDPYYSSSDLFPKNGPLEDWASAQLSRRHHAQTSSLIEEQLSAIQHRRKERQRHLISHLQEGGALSSLATGDLGSGFVSPYRSPYEADSQLRPVECSWCGQRMRFSEFPYHAATCKPLELRPAEEQQRERPKAPSKIPPRIPDDPAPPEAQIPQQRTPPEPAKQYGRTCKYCGLDKPKEHDAECGEKKISCKVCHSIIRQKDKQHHKATCQLRHNPKKYDSNATAEHRERMVKLRQMDQQQQPALQSSNLSVDSRGSSSRNEVI